MCEALRAIGLLVYPYMPDTGDEIWSRLGMDRKAQDGRTEELSAWGGLKGGLTTRRGESLFPRIEVP
jgi:methionyl-tRNA synthetase